MSLRLRDYATALDCYTRVFALQQQALPELGHPALLCSGARLRHDLGQLEYLKDLGRLTAKGLEYIQNLHEALAVLEGSPRYRGVFPLDERLYRLLPHYNRALHVYRPGPVAGSALNPKLDFEKLDRQFALGERKIVVTDGFLTPEALRELRRFCDESVFWFDMHRDEFIGAHFLRGFSCGLLFQIAAELQEKFPRTIGPEPLYAAWAFRCGSGTNGVRPHTDDGKVSINFWITPESANLDPSSGGLVLYDAKTPRVWTKQDWYGNDQMLTDFIEARPESRVVIPYGENRCAIFASRLVHHSDEIRFREGYENIRTNVALIFGDAYEGRA